MQLKLYRGCSHLTLNHICLNQKAVVMFKPESCSDVGEKLYQALKAQGLLK